MKYPQQGDWLDAAILEAAPDWRPETDFNAWRAAHADALNSLGLQAGIESGRCMIHRPLMRLAIAAGVVIAGAIGLYGVSSSLSGTSRAFARVSHNVGESRTIQFDITSRSPTGQAFTGRVYEKDGYLIRTVMDLGDAALWDTILRDKRAGLSLYLDTRGKRAWRPGPELRVEDATPSIYELFKDFLHAPGYSISRLGERQTGDRMAVGFRLARTDASVGRMQYSIWADPETMRPVQINFAGRTPEGGAIEQTITNIVFDEPLDDSLFDFQPQGYQIDPPGPEQEKQQSSGSATDQSTAGQDAQAAAPAPLTGVQTAAVDTAATSQAVTGVSGVVVDKLTQKPIEGALVTYRASDPNASTRTDASGRFRLTGMEPSEQRYISVVAGDCISQRIVLQVSAGRINEGVRVEMDPASRVEGIVRDVEGKPIAGATVATFFFTNLPVVTGPDGRFEIDGLNPVVNSYMLQATHPDYPAVQQDLSPAPVGQTVRQDIILKPGVDVYGTVTDANGKAVQGATVANTTSGAMWNCIHAQTDAQGRYRLENVETGELVLWAVHSRYAPSVQRTQLEEGQAERQIDIRLPDARTLNGQVVDGAGVPVAGAIVVMDEYEGVRNWDDNRRPCDPNGRFVITNVPVEGDLTLWIFGGGVTGTRYQVDLRQDEHRITVVRAGRIFGKVVDAATGKPVREFLVKMTFSQVGRRSAGYAAMWNREGVTFKSPEGLFDTGREDLPVGGQYRVTVYAEGYDALTVDPVVVQPVSEDPNRTVFALTTATLLAGAVVDEQGNPVKDAMIALFSESERYEPIHWQRFTTDADGIFVVSGVSSEQRYVYITAPGYAPGYCTRADLESRDGKPARIVLSAGGRLFGTVFDEKGRPVGGAQVRANKLPDRATGMDYPPPSVDRTTKTDASGHYELPELPTGRIDVWTTSDAKRTQMRKQVSLTPGQSLQVDFGNEEGFVVTGVVRRGPTPVADARVDLTAAGNDSRMSHTDDTGRFRFRGIPAGPVDVTITWPNDSQAGSGTRTSRESRTVQIPSDIELDLDLGANSVSGTIPDVLKGREGLRISVRRWISAPAADGLQGARAWENVFRANADMRIQSNGEFTCGELRAGRYYLVLSDRQRTLGITDVFDLSESGHKQGVQFHTGNGRLNIRVVDAGTGQGIAGTVTNLVNDLEWAFEVRRIEDGASLTRTDAQGSIVYDQLPSGRYEVACYAFGYLRVASDFTQIWDHSPADVTMALSPAAMAGFELSEGLARRVEADSVAISCRVTDLATGTAVPAGAGVHASEEHSVTLSLKEPHATEPSLLHLPEGKYRIDYSVRPYDTVQRIMRAPFHEGTVTAELTTGRITTIRLDD